MSTSLGRKVAGIPNITGGLISVSAGLVEAVGSGAMVAGKDTARQLTWASTKVSTGSFSFDASLSSSIYGSSTTVTPLSLSSIFIIKY